MKEEGGEGERFTLREDMPRSISSCQDSYAVVRTTRIKKEGKKKGPDFAGLTAANYLRVDQVPFLLYYQCYKIS